jgi:O-antigen ligase
MMARQSSRLEPAAWLGLALLSFVWSWWAWQKGAYFGVVLLPGAILLCVATFFLVRFGPWRIDVRLSRPVIVAIAGLVGLGGWALLSALWSPAPDVAVFDGQRILVYALVFTLGISICNLLGPRMKLALVPLAAAGAFAGVVTVITLMTSDSPGAVLERAGTLEFPLGYRNAEAAFFAIALFPALGLAADRDLDWRLRAAGLGTATMCIELFLLAQSRGSVPAMVAGLVIYTLMSPYRLRAISWLGLAVLPALLILPALTALFHAADPGLSPSVLDEMHHAGVIAALTTLAGVGLGVAGARLESRLPGLRSHSRESNRAVGLGLAGTAIVLVIAFVATVGDPVHWLGDRADEFKAGGTPDLSDHSSRFTFNAGSDRYDIWRVALGEAASDPLFGDGGGGFQYAYLREREVSTQNLRDAHSVELETLSELGLPGLALLVAALIGAAIGIVRASSLGPSAASLGAIALASGGYWLVHSSVDWFWPYPAITAPVLALAGAACAPAIRTVHRQSTHRWRGWLFGGLAVLAVSAIPPWLSERYVNDAYATWRTDLSRAYDDLDNARRLDALDVTPLIAEGAIAQAADDRARALVALRAAAEDRPEEWVTHYLLAELQAKTDRAVARNEIRVALELNPLDAQVRALAEDLGVPVVPD